MTDLNARYDPDCSEDENDDALTLKLKRKIKQPQPDGEFVEVQLGDDPTKTVKIGAELSEEVKVELMQCLRNLDDLPGQLRICPGFPQIDQLKI